MDYRPGLHISRWKFVTQGVWLFIAGNEVHQNLETWCSMPSIFSPGCWPEEVDGDGDKVEKLVFVTHLNHLLQLSHLVRQASDRSQKAYTSTLKRYIVNKMSGWMGFGWVWWVRTDDGWVVGGSMDSGCHISFQKIYGLYDLGHVIKVKKLRCHACDTGTHRNWNVEQYSAEAESAIH